MTRHRLNPPRKLEGVELEAFRQRSQSLEEHLMRDMRAVGITGYRRQYKFAARRRFAFDFAWPERKIAVEVEGGTSYRNHHHMRQDGYESDCVKYNLAALNGWMLLRYTKTMIESGHAIRELEKVLG